MNAWLRAFFASLDDRNSPAERGTRLLKSQLTSAQARQYELFGWFDVIGSDTGSRFRIHHGDTLNVEEFDQAGKCLFRWCFMPIGNWTSDSPLVMTDKEHDREERQKRGEEQRNHRVLGHTGTQQPSPTQPGETMSAVRPTRADQEVFTTVR